MAILFFCISLAAIAIILHLISLKIKIPRQGNPVKDILSIFLIVLISGLALAYFLSKRYAFLPNNLWQYAQVVIFYVPVMLSYIINYVALEDDSPTMTIVGLIEQMEKKGGCSCDKIKSIISDEALIWPRINTMIKDGWIEYRDNKYQITERGKTYNKIFALGLKLLNIKREG